MRRRGFSLLEMMIVVAIVGILAAIAIPNYTEMQMRAKRAEVPPNLAGIRTAETAYQTTYDVFLTTNPNPTGSPGREARTWSATDATWLLLAWRPDGPVRATYAVDASAETDFSATGTCDVDGDGDPVVYTATRNAEASLPVGDEHVY
jgi:prepilin-type N-terminal cleavage/methylation domain-containing protein